MNFFSFLFIVGFHFLAFAGEGLFGNDYKVLDSLSIPVNQKLASRFIWTEDIKNPKSRKSEVSFDREVNMPINTCNNPFVSGVRTGAQNEGNTSSEVKATSKEKPNQCHTIR